MKISDKRLLRVIEGLCIVSYEGKGKGELNAEDIYMIAHLARDCKNQHKDWRLKFLAAEKQLKENGYIS